MRSGFLALALSVFLLLFDQACRNGWFILRGFALWFGCVWKGREGIAGIKSVRHAPMGVALMTTKKKEEDTNP